MNGAMSSQGLKATEEGEKTYGEKERETNTESETNIRRDSRKDERETLK